MVNGGFLYIARYRRQLITSPETMELGTFVAKSFGRTVGNSCCGHIFVVRERNRFVSCLFVAGTFSELFVYQNGYKIIET